MRDSGRILFPSLTVCKNEMYNSSKGISSRLQSGAGPTRLWFGEKTFRRSQVVKFVSIKTEAGSDTNNYPCNTVRGPRVGERCSFPFRYPDCRLGKKMRECDEDPGLVPVVYNYCSGAESEGVWCYTKTYTNRSGIIGEWGYCDNQCNLPTPR